jgi:hypothetical protein
MSAVGCLRQSYGEKHMHADRFEVRLAKVRHRFATTLESKIKSVVVSANTMSRSNDGMNKHISKSYKSLHSISGVGPTVGFTATGEAACSAEATLMSAYRAERELSESEILNLKKALEQLRVAAASDLKLMYQRGG